MLKNKKLFSISLKWGIILGIMLAFLEILKMFARKVDYQASQLLDLAMIIGFILVLFYGVRDFKDSYPERLSFAKAFLSATLMSLVAAVVIFAYDLLHYSFIEKDGLQSKYLVATQKYKQNLANDTISADELNVFTKDVSSYLQLQADSLAQCALPDTTFAEIREGIDVFQQFYCEKLVAKPENAADNYKLGKFTKYAKRVLIETLESYVAQNSNRLSTEYVQSVVQKANSYIDKLDPLQIRFENNKNKVPRYDKNGQYALISALIYLLYGMFFGIFVAMYHYRSKEPIVAAEADDEVEEIENLESDNQENNVE